MAVENGMKPDRERGLQDQRGIGQENSVLFA